MSSCSVNPAFRFPLLCSLRRRRRHRRRAREQGPTLFWSVTNIALSPFIFFLFDEYARRSRVLERTPRCTQASACHHPCNILICLHRRASNRRNDMLMPQCSSLRQVVRSRKAQTPRVNPFARSRPNYGHASCSLVLLRKSTYKRDRERGREKGFRRIHRTLASRLPNY